MTDRETPDLGLEDDMDEGMNTETLAKGIAKSINDQISQPGEPYASLWGTEVSEVGDVTHRVLVVDPSVGWFLVYVTEGGAMSSLPAERWPDRYAERMAQWRAGERPEDDPRYGPDGYPVR